MEKRATRKFRERVGRELGFELLYINITSGDPAVYFLASFAAPHVSRSGKRGEKGGPDWQHVARS